jgi:YggT family protein
MGILSGLIQLYIYVLIAYVIASYVPRPPEPLIGAIRLLRSVVDPVLTPMRARIPPLRLGGVGLDVSILILFFLLSIVQSVLRAQGL